MSETKWTPEQWDAITEKDCNLLVAAAAGAGKTAVLVERIIKKITDEKNPFDIDRLLIVTFTNAAATEMRERIADAISGVLEKNPDSRLIQRQLALLGKASITTIHSFCLEVIRSNFQSVDIDPGFRIADETESTLMKLEALNDLFEEQYELQSNEAFFDLLESYGRNKDDQRLMEMVSDLYDFIQSSPWPMQWLDEMTERMNMGDEVDFGQTTWGRVLLDAASLELLGSQKQLEEAIGIIRNSKGLEPYLPAFLNDITQIQSLFMLMKEGNWDSIFEALQIVAFETLGRCGKDVDKEKQEAVKELRDSVKASIKKLREKLIMDHSAGLAADMNALYPKMKYLSQLVKALHEKYAARKSKKSVVDFNDLEHLCLAILSQKDEGGKLVPSPVALAYRERFKEILVDEYQDSNMVQEMMISMISRADSDKPNVFMVGDVKQSIYRFRQARPELFLQKYNTYSNESGNRFRKIMLYKNFRSRKGVVDAVNFIFRQIMSVNAGELDYTEKEALNPGAVFMENGDDLAHIGGDTELYLVQTGDSADSEQTGGDSYDDEDGEAAKEDEEFLDNIQCEARLVATRIQELLKPDENGKYFSVYDKNRKAYRRVEFRDMVILLRTTAKWSDCFVDELMLYGIPAFADAGSGFFKTVEVQVVLSLLQIVDNPFQDIPLLSVLRSPIGGFTTGEMAELRLANRKGPLYEALLDLIEKGATETASKARQFNEKLNKWREQALYVSTDQLIWSLYMETGYYDRVGAMPAGEQRQANLRILFERARQFEATSFKGLFNFISFIDKLKGSRGDMGSAKILGENDNVVRIMSIHKSKGLEFPVVFLSGCGKKFNLQDMNSNILLHQDLGFGPDVVDHKLRLSWPSAAKQAIREKIKAETLSEEMRILYVALTRAREKLIITGSVNDYGKALGRWMGTASSRDPKLPDYALLKGNNYLDWIVPAVLRHKACEGFRSAAPIGTGFEGQLLDDASVWKIRLGRKDEVKTVNVMQEADTGSFFSWLDGLGATPATPEIANEIDRRLNWEYAYIKASKVPAKVTVTELKRRYQAQLNEDSQTLPDYLPRLVKKPLFLEEKEGLNAAEKGTALHFVMQHLELSLSSANPIAISSQIETLVTKELLTRQQADSIEVDKILVFLSSDIGRRLLASHRINREIPFNMVIPCCELYPDMNDEVCVGETILLQGVIDCFFEEADGLILLDYKTDHIIPGREDSIKERYELQIRYYARALEMLTGKRVKEKALYLFSTGKVLAFE